MKKRLVVIGVIVGLVSVLASFFLLRGENNTGKLTLYGNVDIRQVSLAFEEAGRIQTLNVWEGDKVTQGDVLGSLDTRTLKIQAKKAQANLAVLEEKAKEYKNGARAEEITQSEAQLASTKAKLTLAKLDLQRLEESSLKSGGRAVSLQDVDIAKANLEVAQKMVDEKEASHRLLLEGVRQEVRDALQGQLNAQQAELELLHHRIAQGKLIAPTNAVVRTRLQEAGDMTNSQKTVYTLALSDDKWVRVWVSEKDLGRIQPNMGAKVMSDGFPDRAIMGRVGYISSVAEFTPKTVQTEELRTKLVYETRIIVEDSDNNLRMGQPVTVVIEDAKF